MPLVELSTAPVVTTAGAYRAPSVPIFVFALPGTLTPEQTPVTPLPHAVTWHPLDSALPMLAGAAPHSSVSEEACHHKHFTAPGAGRADILLVPNYEVGNGIGKAATLFGGAKNAGIILGAKVPIVLVSRADSAHSKLASIALGSVLAARMDLT